MRPILAVPAVLLSAFAFGACAQPHTIDITAPGGSPTSATPPPAGPSLGIGLNPASIPTHTVTATGPAVGSDGTATLITTATWKLRTVAKSGVLCLQVSAVKDNAELGLTCAAGEHTAPIVFKDTDVDGSLLTALVPAGVESVAFTADGSPLTAPCVPLPKDVTTEYKYALIHTQSDVKAATLAKPGK